MRWPDDYIGTAIIFGLMLFGLRALTRAIWNWRRSGQESPNGEDDDTPPPTST
jgi:hypothetical protein